MEAKPSREFIPKGASIFGINSRRFKALKRTPNRNKSVNAEGAKDLTTDLKIHLKLFDSLKQWVPGEKVLIAESGISTPEDLKPLMEKGFNGALIGAGFLKHIRSKKLSDPFLVTSNFIPCRRKGNCVFRPRGIRLFF